MKTILQRYLGASFIMPFMVSTIFFVSFLLTFQLFKITRLVVNKGVPLGAVVELLTHISVSFLPMAIPLSALFAGIYTLNKISGDSEFLVMRSFGLSRFKIFLPFLIIGMMIGAITYSLNQSIIPHSTREFKKALILLTSKGFLADIKAGSFFTSIPNVTLFAERVENKGKNIFDVFIQSKNVQNKDENVIYAKSGELVKTNVNKWGHSTLRLRLHDGNIVKTTKDGVRMEKIIFSVYDFPISDGAINAGLVTKDSMRNSSDLFDLIKLSPAERKKLKITEKDNIKTRIEFWSRINTPLLCVVFVLLGFALGVKNTRGRTTNSGVICIMILVIYYTLFFTGISIAQNNPIIAPEIAVFLPTLIGLISGIYLYRKLEWVG